MKNLLNKLKNLFTFLSKEDMQEIVNDCDVENKEGIFKCPDCGGETFETKLSLNGASRACECGYWTVN